MREPIRARLKGLLQPGIDTFGYTSAAYVGLKSQVNDLAGGLIRFDQPPQTSADDRLRTALRAIQPVAVDHSRLTRVGREGDGGYVMLGDEAPAAAVSIGIGPDVSWDQAVAARGATVSMFDHTIRRLPAPVPGGHFHRLGVGPRDGRQIRTLASLMDLAGVRPGQGAYLKMDVEGAEWSCLAGVDEGTLDAFDQIVMELHDLDRLLDDDQAADVLSSFELLAGKHAAIHVHANNYARIVRFGQYWFPAAVEISMVNRRHLPQPLPPATCLASHLDFPCDPRVVDVDLSGITRLMPEP